MTIAMIIAITYLFVIPDKAANANGIIKSLLLYGHSACWIAIAAASGLWAIKGANRWTASLLYGALAMYIGFIAATIINPPQSAATINNYRACEEAGGRIAESYPTQCFIDGKSFINDAQQ